MDGHVSRPERHDQLTIIPEQAEDFNSVFGQGPLRYAAASWAPMTVAVISEVIMAYLERESYILEPGRCIEGKWVKWVASHERVV